MKPAEINCDFMSEADVLVAEAAGGFLEETAAAAESEGLFGVEGSSSGCSTCATAPANGCCCLVALPAPLACIHLFPASASFKSTKFKRLSRGDCCTVVDGTF